MPLATLEEQKQLGLVGPAPGIKEIDPETKVRLADVDPKSVRVLMKLSPDQMTRVKKVMKDAVIEWRQNTSLQNRKLLTAIDRMDGISAAKDYPWPNSSNLNIPYTEIQILIATDIVSSTTLDADPAFFIRELLPARKDMPEESVDAKMEWWLNWVFKKQLNLDESARMGIFLAFRDPIGVTVLDWVEEYPKEYSVQVFDSVESFQKRFPDAQSAGVSQDTYDRWMGLIGISHQTISLEIEERVVRYRGPKSREVELKDFIRYPVNSKSLEYTIFHGDQFRERKPYFKGAINRGWFYKTEAQALLENPGKNTPLDSLSQKMDINEGIASQRRNPDEYDCVRGNLRIDMNDDGEEELYHVVYNEDHDKLLRMEKYPYWHNRSNYIIWRIRRKPNRLLGRCFVDMLGDLNEEMNTQHNQRIDSRTITTVPTFKINSSETDLMARMERGDGHFYPGQTWIMGNLKNMEMLETKVDFQGTLQEEQNLFSIGDMLTGTASSGARSGMAEKKDPRASGKKQQAQIQQSNQRIDGYIRELKTSLNEMASQTLELYYQFSPDSVLAYNFYDDASGNFIRNEIRRTQLRNRNMTIDVARVSVLDNPDSVLQRAATDYQMWKDEPLIGMNLKRRWQLVYDTLVSERKKNIPKLLPNLQDIQKEMEEQDKQMGGGQEGSSSQALLQAAHGAGNKKREPDGKRQGKADHRPSELNRGHK